MKMKDESEQRTHDFLRGAVAYMETVLPEGGAFELGWDMMRLLQAFAPRG